MSWRGKEEDKEGVVFSSLLLRLGLTAAGEESPAARLCALAVQVGGSGVGGGGGGMGKKKKVVSLRLSLKDASAAIRCPARTQDGI